MTNKRKWLQRFCYGFGGVGQDTFYYTLTSYFMAFVTVKLFSNVSDGATLIAIVSGMIMVIRIIELVIDPFIGSVVDNTKSKFGKFVPWLVTGAIFASIFMCILFSGFGNLAQTNKVLFMILFSITYILMDISYSFKDISFWSMIPGLSLEDKERGIISTFARGGCGLGQTLTQAIIIPFVVFFSKSNSGFSKDNFGTLGDRHGWFMFSIYVGVWFIISSLVVALGTKEVKHDIRKYEKIRFKDVFNVILKNDQLLWIGLGYGLFCLAVSFTTTAQVLYFKYVVQDAPLFTTVGLINTVIGLGGVFLFPVITKKMRKMDLAIILFVIMIVAFLILSFTPNVYIGSFPVVLIGTSLFFLPQPLLFIIILTSFSDCIEYFQWKNGKRAEGVTLAVRPLLDKFSGAVSNGLIGIVAIVCKMANDVPVESVTSSHMTLFKIIIFGLSSVFILIAILVYSGKVKLDEKMHAQIMKDLLKRNKK